MNNSHNCFNIIVLKISVLFDLSWYATFHCRVFILNILIVQTWLIVHTYFILFECLINKYTYTYYVWFFITVIFEISVLHLFQMIPNAFSLILNALSLIPNIMPYVPNEILLMSNAYSWILIPHCIEDISACKLRFLNTLVALISPSLFVCQ